MRTKGLKPLLMIPLVIFLGCKAQTQKRSDQHSSDTTVYVAPKNSRDEDTLPRVSVKVNKQYDNKGNLKMYDSSYSYSYTSPNGNNMVSDNDSVFSHFKAYFRKNYQGFMAPQYDNVFLNDSLFKYDFFNDDYFLKRFEMNNLRIEDMFKRMDSLKNRFMNDNYPNGKQQKN